MTQRVAGLLLDVPHRRAMHVLLLPDRILID